MDDTTTTLDWLARMATALALGLTVGLERGWHERDIPDGHRVAGWRTFGLIGLAGAAYGVLVGANLIAFGLGLLALALVLGIAHWQEAKADGDFGATTLIAALLTFIFGGLASQGRLIEAGAGAVVTAMLLNAKSLLHAWLQRLSERELRATLQFLLISAVILPILPDRGFGPYDALNPHQIWMMVVLVAGLSFAGYAAMRIWGQNAGLLLTAILGGTVASTAIAFDYSRRMAAGTLPVRIVAAGIVAASGVSFLRTALLVGIFRIEWLPVVAPPLFAMCAMAAVVTWLLWRHRGQTPPNETKAIRNPLELWPALQLGAILAVVLVLAEWLQRSMGAVGLAGLSAVTGMVEIDATTISLGRMVGEGLATHTATLMLLLGLAANGVLKLAVVVTIGGMRLGRIVGMTFLGMALTATAILAIIP